ncbi:hypothetical protein Acsp02_80290 [Actinoplanes sp. NBRC 103695]|nr:hypothetical protein Acsp02_80290 [Actinoplanes sp. NBRC 103695]
MTSATRTGGFITAAVTITSLTTPADLPVSAAGPPQSTAQALPATSESPDRPHSEQM